MRRRPLLGVILAAFGVVLPVALVLWLVLGPDRLVSLALDDRFLVAAMVAAVASVVTRLVAVVDVASSWRGSRRVGVQAAMAVVALGVLAVPVAFGVLRIQQARGFLDGFFAGSGVEQPLFSTGPGGGAVLGPDGTLIGPDGQPIAATATGLRTVLLIGGDGAPGRPGNRTDSMMLVMVDQASGRTGLVSVARNLNRMQFPPGTALAERYPGGFPDLANAIFTMVERDGRLMEAYTVADLHPPAVALSQAIGHSLAVTIDDYFFVDMEGFSDVVDAVGGVTLELDREYPIPPNVADPSRPVPPSVGPGVVVMDGPLATGYARTRALDSDIGRTTRQRQLLSALVGQTSAPEALVRLPQITEAADGAFLTSLSRGQLPDLMRSLSGPAVVESMGLATPLVNSGNPNWDEIRSIVDEVRQALITGAPSRFAVGTD
jgi:LCP family protein required for cell wall assembly